MTQLSSLYDGDKALTDPVAQGLRATIRAPHPLHGVQYADGVILCGRSNCTPCREYRRAQEGRAS